MKSALKSAQVFKGGGPWDSGEKQAKVEALSRSRVGMIHSANSKTVLSPFGPLICLCIPDILGRIVLVEKEKHRIALW